jgi:formylglycine-generating enzyme required for sulfatase activity
MKPDFEQLAAQSERNAVENKWFDIPEQDIQIGIEDPENGDGPARYFGWDVEKPLRRARVPALMAKARPITNGEYAKYMSETGKEDLPASWTVLPTSNGVNGVNGHHMNGHAALHEYMQDKAVRTLYGLVPLKYALHWPVAASYDELSDCAKYMGGRIPTLEEARSIYHHAASLKKKEASNALGRTIPAVNRQVHGYIILEHQIWNCRRIQEGTSAPEELLAWIF